jgi:hypothetical protein
VAAAVIGVDSQKPDIASSLCCLRRQAIGRWICISSGPGPTDSVQIPIVLASIKVDNWRSRSIGLSKKRGTS